jgi:acyl-CoA thioester hydrolase
MTFAGWRAPSDEARCRKMSDSQSFPVMVELPVLWGDMDALGHVNNAVYARWLEEARIRYFECIKPFEPDGVGPILARQVIDFRLPVVYPDSVTVAVRVARMGTTSLTLKYQVHSAGQGAVAVEAESVIVVYDYVRGSKVAISGAMRERIEKLESGS